MTIKGILFLVLSFFCFSCGIEKYYTYEQPNEIYTYRDSLIAIELTSLVDQESSYHMSYVRIKKETDQSLFVNYIKTYFAYYDSGQIRTTNIENLQIGRVEERLFKYITPPEFQNISNELREPKQSAFTLYNYSLTFKKSEQIPKIKKTIYLIDSIGYSFNGQEYHFTKQFELTRKTHRYFWFLRDD